MKKILVVLMLIVGNLSFGEVVDDIKALTKEEKAAVEKRIDEVKKTTDLDFKVKYSKEKDIQQLKEVEKSVIINFIKITDSDLKVSINFTQDIEIQSRVEEIEENLNTLESYLEDGDSGKYTIELIGAVEESILAGKEDMELEKEAISSKGATKGKFLIIIGILLLILALGVLVLKRTKQLKR